MNHDQHIAQGEKIVVMLSAAEIAFAQQLMQEVFYPQAFTLSMSEVVEIVFSTVRECYNGARDHPLAKDEIVKKILDQMHVRKERRKFLRLKKSFIAGFRKIETTTDFSIAETENVGLGGFKIDVPYLITPLACGQVIEISLKNSQENHEPLKGIGKVAWLKKKEHSNGYEIGIMLSHIKEEDKAKLQQFLEEDKSTEK